PRFVFTTLERDGKIFLASECLPRSCLATPALFVAENIMSAHKPHLDSGPRTNRRLSRRGFLQIGTLGIAGFTLPQLLRAEATAGIKSSTKSIINVHLDGGPPQMDMIDLKP